MGDAGGMMERYITDHIFTHVVTEKSLVAELRERRIYEILKNYLSGVDYLKIEEEINAYYDLLGKEMFYYGFIEGMRFILKAM